MAFRFLLVEAFIVNQTTLTNKFLSLPGNDYLWFFSVLFFLPFKQAERNCFIKFPLSWAFEKSKITTNFYGLKFQSI